MPTNPLLTRKMEQFRRSLANIDALPQLSALAVLIGASTGLIIVLFRWAIEAPFLFSKVGSAENFEAFSAAERVAIIMGGCLVIAIYLRFLPSNHRQMSVGHVIDRLHNHQGKLPGLNWLSQFSLAIIAIVSGQSAGREGPAVHLGAGAASQTGQWLRLPSNSMQTLIACGVAAAISASFNTPLAGVIFAMEVILMEYSIVGFVPVILSSVIGSAICHSLIGNDVAFDVGVIGLSSLTELGLVFTLGIILAVLAGTYIRINLFTLRFAHRPVFVRITVAGVLTSAVAIYVPEIMGLGYDTIQNLVSGQLLISGIILITLAKLLLTPVVVGLGIPGGLIGPTLLVGACCGAILGMTTQIIFPEQEINVALYVLIGMAGMMAAVINAPLAALIAVLELSHSPAIIFPAMLVIVVACTGTRLLFKVRGIFIEQLAQSGRDIELGPATRALRRASVTSIMDRKFVITDAKINVDTAREALKSRPRWILFSWDDSLHTLWAADLAHHLENLPGAISDSPAEQEIILDEVPGRKHHALAIYENNSLFEALSRMNSSQHQVAFVTTSRYSHRNIHGVLTLDAIKNYYQPRELQNVMG